MAYVIVGSHAQGGGIAEAALSREEAVRKAKKMMAGGFFKISVQDDRGNRFEGADLIAFCESRKNLSVHLKAN